MVLIAFIGPMRGLNMRNVVFHGFITSTEFNDEYVSPYIHILDNLNPTLNSQRPP